MVIMHFSSQANGFQGMQDGNNCRKCGKHVLACSEQNLQRCPGGYDFLIGFRFSVFHYIFYVFIVFS